ncbi:hypothetical protein R1sor_001795 [Riccia sorocarpa]|uniref:Uncharacterized protein n=1 Tax=Riccia sorocarpa TaxID=122646 RepID=A0ABD3GXB3_9MARC
MVESEAIFPNALRRLGNEIMQSRSHDLLDQAKITAQELVREAHLEAYALIEEAKVASLEAESNAADIVAHARSRAGEIETQALQNARDNEETVPDLVERTRTRRERDAARKRAKYWREKELEMQLGLGCERVSSVRSVRTARGVASELVKLFLEAEAPNEFNADFWIMQCSKPLYQLEEDETDDYGNTVYSGDFALQAIWYQQWGRRGTCFIRYGASPESIVRAQDVIHIKFALQPTGTVGGSPSFTLNADTLAEITLSLKR